MNYPLMKCLHALVKYPQLLMPGIIFTVNTAQKMKFSIKDFFSKCEVNPQGTNVSYKIRTK